MLLLRLYLLALSAQYSFATSRIAEPSSPDPIDGADTAALDPDLQWERVNDSANLVVACSARFGFGLEARSCFDALNTAPHGTEQETWVIDGYAPPGIRHAVRLPELLFSSM